MLIHPLKRPLYKVNLDIFEGPLDLLLFLIRKNEIDIHDIPISTLTEEYLQALQGMREADLNIAGDFLVMAANLMLIKSRMLLPVESTGDGEEEEIEDPRTELVQRLLEYKQFKEAAESFKGMELKQRDIFGRLLPMKSMSPVEEEEDEDGLNVNLYDLLKAFQKILEELPEHAVKEIPRDEVKVAQKINDILDALEESESISFTDIFKKQNSRQAMVATFLAMLELAKMRSIKIRQSNIFGDIRIFRGEKPDPDATIDTDFDGDADEEPKEEEAV